MLGAARPWAQTKNGVVLDKRLLCRRWRGVATISLMDPIQSPAQGPAEPASNPLRSRMLEHDLLRVFIAVVDYGGYTAAAQMLNRTQAAVSQQIRRLEESAQVALFQHPRRTVQLTEQGVTLLGYARRLVSLNDEALSSLRSDEISGRVRIGANNFYATTILPPLLAEFCAQHPEVQIEMHTGVAADMEKRLGSTFDLAINIHETGKGRGTLLRRAQACWVTSLHHSPHRQTPVPLALLPQGSLMRTWAIAALAEVRRPWHLAQESSNIAALEAATMAGLAVGVFHLTHIPTDKLRVLTEEDGFPALPVADVCLETAERYLPKAAVKLHEFLRGVLVGA